MRVLMLTQAVDPADPLLAFAVEWIKALAVRVDGVDVLCARATETDLPRNVAVWTFGEQGGGRRVRRFARFVRTLRLLAGNTDVVFAHMVPRFAWLAAPFASRRDRPIVLWYVHRDASAELRLATACSARVATAVPSSFPLATRKLSAIGHGIDAAFYSPDPEAPARPPNRIVMVGRLMPIKHQATLVRAVHSLGPSFDEVRVTLAGGVPQGASPEYERMLRGLVAQLGLTPRIEIAGALPPEAVRDLYRGASVAVNLSPEGLFDKAVLESMMVETPTLVCNPAFDDLLGEHAAALRIEGPEDAEGLASALGRVLAMPEASRRAMTSAIASRARGAHGLQRMMDRLVALMRDLAGAE